MKKAFSGAGVFILIIFILFHLLYSINPSLCTDTTGCGTCQNSIYNIVKQNYYTLYIDENTYKISGSGRYLYAL
jgi:hypothetical protein